MVQNRYFIFLVVWYLKVEEIIDLRGLHDLSRYNPEATNLYLFLYKLIFKTNKAYRLYARSLPRLVSASSVASGAAPEAVLAVGDNCVKMAQGRMTYNTRRLQELPRITMNDINRIVRQSAVTPNSKKENGFKLLYANSIWLSFTDESGLTDRENGILKVFLFQFVKIIK